MTIGTFRNGIRIEGRDKNITENVMYVSIGIMGIEFEFRVWNWRRK